VWTIPCNFPLKYGVLGQMCNQTSEATPARKHLRAPVGPTDQLLTWGSMETMLFKKQQITQTTRSTCKLLFRFLGFKYWNWGKSHRGFISKTPRHYASELHTTRTRSQRAISRSWASRPLLATRNLQKRPFGLVLPLLQPVTRGRM
jgi:hypothetical protein